ncbi:hypothetical protein BGX28_001222 [Mortierella sp. GBA30]|nr:hypothetical protein BGX28_001222 [Mortierella sp. GBA30]
MRTHNSNNYNTHCTWLARTLVPLALLAATVQAVCVPLATSKACSGYAAYQVDTNVVKKINDMSLGINLNAFQTVEDFDRAVYNATGLYTSPSTCKGYSPAQRIRYQDTPLCTLAVQESSGACKASSVPNMCVTSCLLYETALKNMVDSICPNDTASKNGIAMLNGICTGNTKDWYGWQGSEDNCVNATMNQAATCGFSDQLSMCKFCTDATNQADTCCAAQKASCAVTSSLPSNSAATSSGTLPASPTSSSDSNNGSSSKSGGIGGLSAGALGGIIGGGVVLILGLFALIVCCMRRSRSTAPAKGQGSSNLSRHMSNSSASKYKISSPKIQEEGFAAAVPTSSAPIPMTALPTISSSEPAAAAVAAAAAANRISKGSSIGGGGGNGKQSYCQALYPYQASMADELDLAPGDIVQVQRVFDDGWAVGVNMNTSNEGAFPVVCVMFVDEASLDDDFEDVNMHSMTPMGHREDEGGRSTPRSSMPSRASSPVHLPRRHSSMLRDSAVLPQGNNLAPMNSSPLAGGKLQPPAVRDTMLSDASSINRWWDGEGAKQ